MIFQVAGLNGASERLQYLGPATIIRYQMLRACGDSRGDGKCIRRLEVVFGAQHCRVLSHK